MSDTSTPSNSLAHAASAYLRSAMHQPTRWYEWGQEAFAAAQAADKPILLDIGAVWCHWCHVMDRESYDDPGVAELINDRFIAIKVDRDERPDVDSRHQAAVSAISGQGGWPLTVFLTPDGRPFYGGTYFPPNESHGRPSFRRVLMSISEAYKNKLADVTQSADQLMSVLQQAETFAGKGADFSPAIVRAIIDSAAKHFDERNGGFGNAPKFPHPATMDLLIDASVRTGEHRLKTIVATSLEKMARGGVYDQIAGGFHRYSVDEHWIVPHFEKMSYDNSELLKNYVHAWQAIGNPFFAEVARDIIRWMDTWLSDRERGGFYASQDADINLDDDGDHFTWSLDEARAVLSSEELEVAAIRYDIGEVGEMHHDPKRNVLYVRTSINDIAPRVGKSSDQVQRLLQSAKQKMYAARLLRPIPFIDKTVYVNWNAMSVCAYLVAAHALDLDDAKHFALKTLDRLLSEAWQRESKHLLHVIAYADPTATHREVTGMLEDYAFMVTACLDAYESTADMSYYRHAHAIADAMIERFHDAVGGGFFDSGHHADRNALGALRARRKPFQDAPTPAGNPAAAIALLRLHAYSADGKYKAIAEETLEVFAALAPQYGMFAGTYGVAGVLLSQPHIQVVVVGDDTQTDALHRAATKHFALNLSVLRLPASAAVAQNLPPSLAETIPNLPAIREHRSVAIVCSGFTCQPPFSDVGELTTALQSLLSS